MYRMSSTLALCAAFALSGPALAMETLQQMDAEPAREAVDLPEPEALDERTRATDSVEQPSDAGAVASIATAGLEAGEATAPSAAQMRPAPSAPAAKRPGARWNAFLPGMVR